MRGEIREEKHRLIWDCVGAAALFVATAAVVLWQNSRLAVLWDLSYVLENSFRISLGQVPYRDFPFPYAPGTFLVQALLIRLTGRVFFHHVLYCAIVGGAATVLTWRILRRLLRRAFSSFRLLAFLLALPLSVLGIYCIFPHPFYDPDCTFAILCAVFLLLWLEQREFPPLFAFFTGLACVVPVFVKQNTGIAFLAASGASSIALFGIEIQRRGKHAAGLASLLTGMASGVGAAALLLHFTVGLQNYAHWTIVFAASRRLPRFGEMIAPFENPRLPAWIIAFVAGASLARNNPRGNRWRAPVSVMLMAAPFFWAVLYLFADTDASERAERLLALWPFVLVVSLLLTAWGPIRSLTRGTARISTRGPSMARLLSLVLIGTTLGAFLSQQLWGSTYAIWPFLTILFAGILVELFHSARELVVQQLEWLTAIASACLLIASWFYVAGHERLDYADVSTGEMAHSSLSELRGLSMRGSWIREFEELIHFTHGSIPRNEGLLMIPGEDLFYYTTGRRPQFPVLMFDRTVNPYSPQEIVEITRRRNICWLVVKKDLQLSGEPVEDKDRLLGLLRTEFAPFKEISNYEIYRRPGCTDGPA
jgi:hypothetical protein